MPVASTLHIILFIPQRNSLCIFDFLSNLPYVTQLSDKIWITAWTNLFLSLNCKAPGCVAHCLWL